MKKNVYVCCGGDMECPEFYIAGEHIVEGNNIDEIVRKWCELESIDYNGKWYNDRFNNIEQYIWKNEIHYKCFGRELIIEDVK